MLLLRTDLTEKTMRVAEGRANKVLAFCVAAMVAILLDLLLAANPAHANDFTVTNTDDSGPGSLRQAITDANAGTGADTIEFDIPGTDTGCNATSGVCTIKPSSELPDITDPVIIDGYSQPGTSPNTLAVGNDAVLKIELSGADAPTNTSGLLIKAANSTVKGLIINNWENGVFLDDTGATGNKVQGNYIGANAMGTEALANNLGVVIDGAPNNTIGGTKAAARNIISGNTVHGIRIAFTGATGNQIQGNYMGTSAAGDTKLGNGFHGVAILNNATDNTVGGTTATARNIISGNGQSGVEIRFTLGDNGATAGNRILSNSIHGNDALGIDLVFAPNDPPGVTPNDDGDFDGGANNLQNYPDLDSAKTGRRATTIKGTLNSTANTTFALQFFSSPEADDPSGFGEGKKFRFQKNVTTDSSGNATFTFKTKKKKVPKGQVVTATATNQATGDTSEFSEAERVV